MYSINVICLPFGLFLHRREAGILSKIVLKALTVLQDLLWTDQNIIVYVFFFLYVFAAYMDNPTQSI